MKALTIWQPWASLIIAGAKPYEFRGWRAPPRICGQRIAIHAGARQPKRDEISDLLMRLRDPEDAWSTALHASTASPLLERWHAQPGSLPLSSVLGTAVLRPARSAWEIVEEFGAKLNDSDRAEHANWAWPLTDIEALQPIAPARGAQGLWEWSA